MLDYEPGDEVILKTEGNYVFAKVKRTTPNFLILDFDNEFYSKYSGSYSGGWASRVTNKVLPYTDENIALVEQYRLDNMNRLLGIEVN